MEVNFLIEDDLLSLEVVLLMPLLSLSLCALILLLLQLFLDRQSRNEVGEEEEEEDAEEALVNGNWVEMDEDYFNELRERFQKGPDEIGPRQFKMYINNHLYIKISELSFFKFMKQFIHRIILIIHD